MLDVVSEPCTQWLQGQGQTWRFVPYAPDNGLVEHRRDYCLKNASSYETATTTVRTAHCRQEKIVVAIIVVLGVGIDVSVIVVVIPALAIRLPA